ncbi:MAG: peroxiredoxin [Cyanobacteria bacterium]|nr:peroxiredoxin [Cyanobacteriota bacterium]
MAIQIGDKAPDFSLPTQTGETVTLSSFVGKQPVVVYFYPKDDTPGCTLEACGFRDSYGDFAAAGAVVIGISADSVESHQRFGAKHNLPFLLVSDAKNEARKAFGVPNELFVLPGRVTYVIDREGVVRHIFNSMLNAKGHVEEALKTVRAIAA